MKTECTVDGKTLSLSISSDKPLSLILMENAGIQSLKSICRGNMCGNCLVLMNGRAVLSCLIPAFNIKDAVITTFDGFSKSRDVKDIEKAYASLGIMPCPKCYASRTILIENIIRRYENNEAELNEEEILQESELLKCTCIDPDSFINLVREAVDNRRRRYVRRA